MYGFIITTAGEGMLARASAGEGLTLTEVWVGKGAVESAEAAKALTALLDPVAKATSTTPAVAGGQISMLVEYRNDMGGGLEEGFTLSEFGVMAKVGDDAPTLLYYAALGDRAQPVPPIAEGLDVHRFPVAVGVTGEVAVSLDYPAGVWVTSGELEEALAGIDLSGYVKTSEKGAAGGVATLGEDGKVPAGQLPKMDYDPSGSAAAVQKNLTAHTGDKNNPHAVTAAQVGAFTKGETLTAETAALCGLGADAVPDAMFRTLNNKIAMLAGNSAGLTVVLKTKSGNPLKNMLVPNLMNEEGEAVYTDESGKAAGFVMAGPVSIPFTGYADIEDYTESFDAVATGSYTKEITLSVRNFLKVTSTQSLKFSKNTSRVDVSVGGAGGGAGKSGQGKDYEHKSGGAGGGGHCTTQENVSFTPDTKYTAVVGAGGEPGEKGGTSSFLGVNGEGGNPGEDPGSRGSPSGGTGNGNGASGVSDGLSSSKTVRGNSGKAGADSIYSSFTGTAKHGGGGGSGSLKRTENMDAVAGGTGGAPGGGPGGAAAGHSTDRNGHDGEDGTGGGGGSGGVWYDDGSTSYGNPGKGGSGAVAIRMHLISA